MGRPKAIEDDALLAVAREVFLAGGAFGSTKEIAARARISEAALFKRFPTKAALFLAAMAPPPADLDFIFAPARAEQDPERALHKLARQVLAYYRMAIPRVIHLITHPAIGLDALSGHRGHSKSPALDRAVTDYLKDEHRKGRLWAPDAASAAALIISTLHSVVFFELMGVHGGTASAKSIDAMMTAIWNGLSPRPERVRRKP